MANDAARLDHTIAALSHCGLIEEAIITGRKPAWRIDSAQRIRLSITGAGRNAASG